MGPISNQAMELIKSMIRFKADDRPTLKKVHEDGYFSGRYNLYGEEENCPGLCVIFNQHYFQV